MWPWSGRWGTEVRGTGPHSRYFQSLVAWVPPCWLNYTPCTILGRNPPLWASPSSLVNLRDHLSPHVKEGIFWKHLARCLGMSKGSAGVTAPPLGSPPKHVQREGHLYKGPRAPMPPLIPAWI